MLKLNPYKIGFRTVKTAVGMTLGVIICKLLGLDNYASSAILVVLCIKHTKMHSVQAILSRLVSCLLILFLGSAIFSLLGQHAFVLGLIVLLFIPLTVVLNVQEGVITSCVILLHVFNAKAINGHLILNEIMLLIVGLGIAFLMNLMMPSLDKKLNHFKQDIENQITEIFNIFSQACSMHNNHLNIKFDSLLLNIKKAKSLAFRDVKNHFVRNENSFYHYFDMREEQVELLKRMTSLLEKINTDDPILEKISQLMYEIGSNVNSNDYTALRLHSLYEIRLSLDDLPLPTTHKTLNSRAHIIQILNELEEYLNIKSQFGSLKLHSEI
ncbi:aromatic acid exporter family protein [Staphylococcus epidermidis]|uniref:aromatic acid exporter family protein n=1 Tax=Staphylococcus epidermidis TaxID=1282 RepID=UPI0011A9A61D|nr:aromatic acid exporter family protein [Staphylococcus epidermidis]MBM0791256.1 aromatic acid exporter family protein [Staphylococcus epidermidis]MCG1163264.1 aromatic acid exporter family protein [Staphylococcus epidermidis]MCG1807510.1 aromatic acid exporter family protein [Staphylococcus epidermidis]MCG2008908.1 aromatic acid exporter family protein [Staphylococcus epidermidis]MCG2041069.1 aromatic acid exporter family protein [Staphylococcus epidermidis]